MFAGTMSCCLTGAAVSYHLGYGRLCLVRRVMNGTDIAHIPRPLTRVRAKCEDGAQPAVTHETIRVARGAYVAYADPGACAKPGTLPSGVSKEPDIWTT